MIACASVLITGFGPFPGAPFNPDRPAGAAPRRAPAPGARRRHAHRARVPHQLCGGRCRAAGADRAAPARRAAAVRARGAHAVSAHRDAGAQRGVGRWFPTPAGASCAPPASGRAGRSRSTGRAPFRRLAQAARRAACRSACRAMPGRICATTSIGARIEQAARTAIAARRLRPCAAGAPRGAPATPKARLTLDDLVRAGEAILLALVSARA